ncbi:RIP metalloprotease RseP [Prolixibacteraceae bacterium JC049]|nr:RIP metalloprotease RseP [Prolixibacteraceae bacterium JC049]
MEILVKAAQLILSLSILVVLHEFGHFLFARVFKCRVEKFYLFFDPWFSLFKTKKGETEYGVGWLPLGGYVKIAGMIDESMDKEALKQPAQPWEFRSKPAWQRLLIMIGGVAMNFIFALIIYSGVLYVWGKQYLPTENAVHGVVVGEMGREMGIQNGDKIVAVNGEPVVAFRKIAATIVLNKATTVEVNRNGEKIILPISNEVFSKLLNAVSDFVAPRVFFDVSVGQIVKDSPAAKGGLLVDDKLVGVDGNTFQYWDQFQSYLEAKKGESVALDVIRAGQKKQLNLVVGENGRVGFGVAFGEKAKLNYETQKYTLMESIPAGVKLAGETIRNYLKQFKLLFSPETKAYKSLGGFIAIGKIFPGQWDWYSFWNMTALLSIILGIMNLLPIPALDGGHVLFLGYEIVSGRKPGEKFLEYAQVAGMILLLALVLFANINDIIKLFA